MPLGSFRVRPASLAVRYTLQGPCDVLDERESLLTRVELKLGNLDELSAFRMIGGGRLCPWGLSREEKSRYAG